MTAADKKQTNAFNEEKALDRVVSWRDADKADIMARRAVKSGQMSRDAAQPLRDAEYLERGKLRDAADMLAPRKVEGSAP